MCNEQLSTKCPPCVYRVSTECPQSVYPLSTADTMCLPCVYHVSTMCLPCVYKVSTKCLQSVHKVSTKCLQSVYKVSTKCLPLGNAAHRTTGDSAASSPLPLPAHQHQRRRQPAHVRGRHPAERTWRGKRAGAHRRDFFAALGEGRCDSALAAPPRCQKYRRSGRGGKARGAAPPSAGLALAAVPEGLVAALPGRCGRWPWAWAASTGGGTLAGGGRTGGRTSRGWCSRWDGGGTTGGAGGLPLPVFLAVALAGASRSRAAMTPLGRVCGAALPRGGGGAGALPGTLCSSLPKRWPGTGGAGAAGDAGNGEGAGRCEGVSPEDEACAGRGGLAGAPSSSDESSSLITPVAGPGSAAAAVFVGADRTGEAKRRSPEGVAEEPCHSSASPAASAVPSPSESGHADSEALDGCRGRLEGRGTLAAGRAVPLPEAAPLPPLRPVALASNPTRASPRSAIPTASWPPLPAGSAAAAARWPLRRCFHPPGLPRRRRCPPPALAPPAPGRIPMGTAAPLAAPASRCP